MAYSFPNLNYFIQPTASDEATPLLSFSVDENFELASIVVHCQKVGIHTNETLKLELHKDEDVDFPLITSDTYTYDDFDISSSHWAGLLTFDFNREPLSSELTYWLKVRVGNYVYSDNSRYISFAADYPEPINSGEAVTKILAGVGVYGYFD